VAWAYAEADGFRWLKGESGIAHHGTSAGFTRAFCRRCGSSLPASDAEGTPCIPIGGLDDEPQCESVCHVFTTFVPSWRAITDDVAQFETLPPGMEPADVPALPTSEPVAGETRGSCVCGGVSWRTQGEPIVARYCHCARCRKARSAACTANLIARIDDVVFLSGEDETTSYHAPDAKFFHQTFCNTCGSATPRIDPNRGIAIVPMGALDDDPGIAPSEHIWVGSKATWHEISDDLPQFDESPPG
jgi:hypothetical protein